jgi:hypothetical protein
MRLACAAALLALCLAGCHSDPDTLTPEITIKLHGPASAETNDAAAAYCKPYGKTAQLKDTEHQSETEFLIYSCN